MTAFPKEKKSWLIINMDVKLNLSNSEHKELLAYCNLNDLLISQVVKDSFTTGFNIERYGLLNSNQEVKEKEVIKEVIKYVEVPVVAVVLGILLRNEVITLTILFGGAIVVCGIALVVLGEKKKELIRPEN